MCELGEKLKNVGERSKAGQKLNRKRGISETKVRAKEREAKGAFCPVPGISRGVPESTRKKNEKKKRKRKRSLPRVHLS